MTALLTPEQIDAGNKLLDAEQMRWIVERAFNADLSNVSARDCRKLLFHVEAIAERLELLRKDMGMGFEDESKNELAEHVEAKLRALVTAIRGNQGDSK